MFYGFFFFFSSRRRHTRWNCDWSSDVCSSDLGAVLTELGEQVRSRDEADAVRRHYLQVLGAIEQRRLGSHVSVKLTHLGLETDPGACRRAVDELAARAKAAGSLLWLDMEESTYVDKTLEVYRAARGSGADVGVALQAYLRRTPKDLEALLPLKPWIRLVKGAYSEPAHVAFPRKRDV